MDVEGLRAFLTLSLGIDDAHGENAITCTVAEYAEGYQGRSSLLTNTVDGKKT